MNHTSYLSLFVITGLLIGGITPGTLAFADEDKLELEIKKEDGITKIEIQTSEKEIELKLDEADNELIVDTILQYVDLPDDIIDKILSLDDSEFEFEYEYEREFDEAREEHDEEFDDEHDDDRDDEEHHDDRFNESIESEALEAIEDAIHEVEEATLRLQDAHDQGLDVSHAEEIIVKAKMLIEEADHAFSQGHFWEAEDLAEHAEELAEEARTILEDEHFDDDHDEFEDHETDGIGDVHPDALLEERIHELERENEELREQIVQLEQTIEDLNTLLMEQLKVIYEWILDR